MRQLPKAWPPSRGHEWVAGLAQGMNVVRVSAANVPVQHEVRLQDFTKWLEKPGGSPREVSQRWEIRKILGMPGAIVETRGNATWMGMQLPANQELRLTLLP
jgi:hypothetical protein